MANSAVALRIRISLVNARWMEMPVCWLMIPWNAALLLWNAVNRVRICVCLMNGVSWGKNITWLTFHNEILQHQCFLKANSNCHFHFSTRQLHSISRESEVLHIVCWCCSRASIHSQERMSNQPTNATWTKNWCGNGGSCQLRSWSNIWSCLDWNR